MKKLIFCIALIAATLSVAAQDGITLHFMRLNPYSTYTSPSAHLQYKGWVGVPVISNINESFTNTSFHYDHLFGTNSDGVITTIKLNDFVDHLSKKNNVFNDNLSLNIIDFGFYAKPVRISVSWRLRVDEYMSFNKDLFALPVHGNMAYVGENNPATPELKLSLTSYQEIGVGIQAEIKDRFYIGVKPKFLLGVANVHTKQARATLYTDPEDYSMKLNYNLDAYSSCVVPYEITLDSNGTPGFNFYTNDMLKNLPNLGKNLGAAIDLGFTCRINDRFGVSASVLDLGFIRWTTYNQHITSSIAGTDTSTYYNDGSFMFNGLSADDVDLLIDDPQAFADELLDYFPLNVEKQKAYTTMLSSRFIVEGYCNLGKHHRLTALFQGRLINKEFLPSFTVAWNGTFLNIFDLCVSYTIAKKSYTNLGVGIGFNLGVFHIYAATDNLIAICTHKSPQRSLVNATNANIQAGIVFDWGKLYEKKLDKDINKKHKNDSVEP